jgi:hypothetical protein
MELKNLNSVLIEYTYYLKNDIIHNNKSISDLKPEESVKIFLDKWKKRIEERIQKELEASEKIKEKITKS